MLSGGGCSILGGSGACSASRLSGVGTASPWGPEPLWLHFYIADGEGLMASLVTGQRRAFRLFKLFYRGSKSISSRSQCFIGTIRSLAAFVSQCGGVGRISLTRRVSLPSVSKSWAYSRGSSPFLWHSPFGNPVKIMASSQNDVFKDVRGGARPGSRVTGGD